MPSSSSPSPADSCRAVLFRITGAVQGVGFRPFVFRLAQELGIHGWVRNGAQGVEIEAQAHGLVLEDFARLLRERAPAVARIRDITRQELTAGPRSAEFRILESDAGGAKTAQVLPDLATCPDCLREILDPTDRRHLYPFTNCTNCGPRFSILERIPYDRPNTSMSRFTMCEACRVEYEDPASRRFHAQPNACPECGPHLEWWDAHGRKSASGHEALVAAAQAIRRGSVVAVKGLGGFHLMVDARTAGAVRLLRERKRREEKPFALMYPSLDAVRADCAVGAAEERLLTSIEAPIVLLRKRPGVIAPDAGVAPGNPFLGAMLPYTPLHHILLRELGFPVVATSGNISDEPLCTDEREAVERLAGIADAFLVHDRPIARPVDDSVVRVTAGREMMLRRARGYTPRPVSFDPSADAVLAVGAHLKNTVALAHHDAVIISQHIGDLETFQSAEAFRRAVSTLVNLYEAEPAVVACDLHPDYVSSRFAREQGLPVHTVQHHHAHVAACMAENDLVGPVLGVAWDGTGLGPDGTVWGGEFLLATRGEYQRAGHFRTFALPGGDRAIREPRRAAIGALYEFMGEAVFDRQDIPSVAAFTSTELNTLRSMLRRGLNCPRTSSAGRLFDVVASLSGLRQVASFEGQGAMELEFGRLSGILESYPFRLEASGACLIIDWASVLECILADHHQFVPKGVISARFHNTMVEVIVVMARRAGRAEVALSGGCFQNAYLTEHAVQRLTEEGHQPFWHRQVPCNDGGVSFGQAVVAVAARNK